MDEELLMHLLTDPEMADQLAQMGLYGDKAALFGQDTKRADLQRGIASPEGRFVGSTYVAASPLEHLGVAMQRMAGQQNLSNARQAQEQLMSGDVAARKGLASAMAQAMRRRREGEPMESIQSPRMLGADEALGGE
jgi:hypothetical protein